MIDLNLTTLILAAFATYRLTRLVVVDNIADPVRTPLLGWLRRGESPLQRVVGNAAVATGVLLTAGRSVEWAVLHLRDSGPVNDPMFAKNVAVSLTMAAIGVVVGHRDYIEDLLLCRWCVGVWTSIIAGVSLSAWGHWPIVPTVVFILATAGAQSFLHLTEDIIETVTARMDDYGTHLDPNSFDEG